MIDPAVVEVLVSASGRRRCSPLSELTPRERDVLAQIAQGRSNAGVAAALHLSERAVEKHINTLFAELGLEVEPDTNRRVMAVLLHLADPDGWVLPPSATGPPAGNDEPVVDVLIVDDQRPLRTVARTVVGLVGGRSVTAEAETGEDAVVAVGRTHPQVVLMSTYAAADLPTDAASRGAVAYLHKEDPTPAALRALTAS